VALQALISPSAAADGPPAMVCEGRKEVEPCPLIVVPGNYNINRDVPDSDVAELGRAELGSAALS
jgi:hypothetical protein